MYKIGDKVLVTKYNDNLPFIGEIVYTESYLYQSPHKELHCYYLKVQGNIMRNLYNIFTESYRYENEDAYRIRVIGEHCKMYKALNNTKLAKKMYPDAKESKDGSKLYV